MLTWPISEMLRQAWAELGPIGDLLMDNSPDNKRGSYRATLRIDHGNGLHSQTGPGPGKLG